jgi:hypothetical protein
MNITQLFLKSLILELRYPHAFRLWDRAGAIWANATHRWPALTLREATPNQTRFTLENRAEVSIHLERAFVNAAGSRLTLEEFIPYCRFIADDVPPLLDINTFVRVGFKSTFLKEYQNMDDALTDFFSTGMTKEIVGKHFGFEGKSEAPNVTIRFEGEYLACTTTLLVRRRTTKLEVQIIGDDDFQPITKDHLELVYECDYFTKGGHDCRSIEGEPMDRRRDACHPKRFERNIGRLTR